MVARIVGNVTPEDEFTHTPTHELDFNESVYFNFFDRAHQLGGFVRLANRPNEGRGEMTVCLFTLGNGHLLFRFERPEVRHDRQLEGGGMHVEVVTPAEHVVTTFAGHIYDLSSPRKLSDPREAFATSRMVPLTLLLHHRAAGPLYGYKEGVPTPRDDAAPAQLYERDPQMGAASHFEQHTLVEGDIELEDIIIHISGLGLRDHSWGPRTWQNIPPYLWFTCEFELGFGLTGLVVWDVNLRHPVKVGGMICRGPRLGPVVRASIEPHFVDDEGFFLQSYRATLGLASGEGLELEAKALAVAPLRNRRSGRVTYLGEALTEFRYQNMVGYGMTEYLRQVPQG